MFGRKKNEDALVLEENDGFYNPPSSDAPVLVDQSDLLPVDDLDDEIEEEEAPKKKERKQRAKRYGRAIEEDEDEVEEEPEESEWHSPVKPSLSLPSRSIVELTLRDGASMRMRKVGVIVGAGLAAALVTCAGLNIYSAGQLSGVKAEGQTLSNSVKALQPVADFYEGYTQRKSAVSEVLTEDIQFSLVQSSLTSIASQNGIAVESETIVPGKPCASIDPFSPAEGLGCVTVQISGNTATSLADMADGISKQKGLSGAYINGINSKDGKATATLNFNYDSNLFSERYQKFGSGDSAKSTTESKG